MNTTDTRPIRRPIQYCGAEVDSASAAIMLLKREVQNQALHTKSHIKRRVLEDMIMKVHTLMGRVQEAEKEECSSFAGHGP